MPHRSSKRLSLARSRQLLLHRYTLIGLILVPLIGGVLLLLYFTIPPTILSGQLSENDTFPGELVQDSLDIALAAKADYPSAPLKVEKDLGVTGSIRTQLVSFSVPTDGLSEFALLEEPAGPPPAKGFPAIILCHGYVSPARYSTLAAYTDDMDFYASHGFAVIKPDYRGNGLSAGHGDPDSGYYSMAYNIDVMSLISALKQTKGIDKTDLNLWGHSLGAYIALRAAVMSKDIKNTILLSAPGGSIKQIYLSYVPPSDENNLFALQTRSRVFARYGTPAENANFWKKASLDSYLSRLTSTVQINVGSADTVVPPQMSADLDQALSAADKKHQYFIYSGAGHGLGGVRTQIWSRSLALLQSGG
jgi:pimeloyl-ACP methyl ester carboxylesterase